MTAVGFNTYLQPDRTDVNDLREAHKTELELLKSSNQPSVEMQFKINGLKEKLQASMHKHGTKFDEQEMKFIEDSFSKITTDHQIEKLEHGLKMIDKVSSLDSDANRFGRLFLLFLAGFALTLYGSGINHRLGQEAQQSSQKTIENFAKALENIDRDSDEHELKLSFEALGKSVKTSRATVTMKRV